MPLGKSDRQGKVAGMTDPLKRRAEVALAAALPAWVRALPIAVDDLRPGLARLRLAPVAATRLGKGTIAAQAILALADAAMRAAVETIADGRQSTAAGITASFLSAPAGDVDLLAEARILKAGSTLVVGEAFLRADGDDRPVAHAVLTFAWVTRTPDRRALPRGRRASRRSRS